jgi:hypothetical protein
MPPQREKAKLKAEASVVGEPVEETCQRGVRRRQKATPQKKNDREQYLQNIRSVVGR